MTPHKRKALNNAISILARDDGRDEGMEALKKLSRGRGVTDEEKSKIGMAVDFLNQDNGWDDAMEILFRLAGRKTPGEQLADSGLPRQAFPGFIVGSSEDGDRDEN